MEQCCWMRWEPNEWKLVQLQSPSHISDANDRRELRDFIQRSKQEAAVFTLEAAEGPTIQRSKLWSTCEWSSFTSDGAIWIWTDYGLCGRILNSTIAIVLFQQYLFKSKNFTSLFIFGFFFIQFHDNKLLHTFKPSSKQHLTPTVSPSIRPPPHRKESSFTKQNYPKIHKF